MNFTITTLGESLADYLAPVLPDVQYNEDPAQQGVDCPCFFLQQRYAYTDRRRSTRGMFLQRIGLDLTYLEDYNLPDLQRRYLAAAEALDLEMGTIPYSDGETVGTVQLHTYERSWNIDLDALHYKFELQEIVIEPPAAEVKMQAIAEYNAEVIPNDGKQETADAANRV